MFPLVGPVRTQDHARGPRNAPVTLVEYGDFECPFCGQAYYVLKEIEAELGAELRRVYRPFPLTRVHPHAETAALASEAAGAQGMFWEMHDLLFEHQDALGDDDLLEEAQSLGLDLSDFELAMRTRAFLPRIRENVLSGLRGGVTGTPTFFINGIRHQGSTEYPVLVEALRRAAESRSAR
jgi:protein-disulfide isomerase